MNLLVRVRMMIFFRLYRDSVHTFIYHRLKFVTSISGGAIALGKTELSLCF